MQVPNFERLDRVFFGWLFILLHLPHRIVSFVFAGKVLEECKPKSKLHLNILIPLHLKPDVADLSCNLNIVIVVDFHIYIQIIHNNCITL